MLFKEEIYFITETMQLLDYVTVEMETMHWINLIAFHLSILAMILAIYPMTKKTALPLAGISFVFGFCGVALSFVHAEFAFAVGGIAMILSLGTFALALSSEDET